MHKEKEAQLVCFWTSIVPWNAVFKHSYQQFCHLRKLPCILITSVVFLSLGWLAIILRSSKQAATIEAAVLCLFLWLLLKLRDSECFGRLSYGRWLTVLLIHRKAVNVEWMLKLKVLQTLWLFFFASSEHCCASNCREVLRMVFKEKFHTCLWEIMDVFGLQLLVWILRAVKRASIDCCLLTGMGRFLGTRGDSKKLEWQLTRK